MYYIKNNIDLNILRKYGFKIGREIPDIECNTFKDFRILTEVL